VVYTWFLFTTNFRGINQMRQSKKGQGIVEYAGALVVAALIVGAVVTAGPSNLAAMFNAVIASVQSNITGLL